MKKIIFYCLSLVILASCGDSKTTKENNKDANVWIKGTIFNAAGENLMLMDVNQKDFKLLDSVHISDDGTFALSAKIPETGVYTLKISDQNFGTIVISPGDSAKVKADAKDLANTLTLTGSKQGEYFQVINNFSKENGYKKQGVQNQMDSIQRNFQYLISQRNDKKYIDSLNKSIEPLFDTLQSKLQAAMEEGEMFGRKFIADNPRAFASIIALNLINPEKDFPIYMELSENLQKEYPNSENLKPFHSWVEEHKAQYMQLPVGSPAPDFTVKDFAGKDIKLSSFRGKITLVDFWASWCGPCRKENPFVVSAYARYKDKGLEVFGVSLDKDKDKWIEAVKKDGLSWKHGSELKEWQSSFVQLYGITGIPFNVLLDKEGKIIGKNLRGPQLEKALEEAFAKNK
jgi:thiol-disulfide isomerase/thioredoxin